MRAVTALLFSAAFLVGVTADPLATVPFSDIHGDKYMALEAVTGGDPHVPVPDLAHKYGYKTPGWWTAPAARTPGALLLAVPAIAVPDSALLTVAHVASVIGVVAICWWAARIGGVPSWVGGLAAVLLVRAPVMLDQYSWGNSGMWVAVMVVSAWFLLPSKWAGVLLGAATVVKLWPALIVVVLLVRSDTRRPGIWAVVSGVGLTAAGLLLPGTSIAGSAGSLIGGADYTWFPSNMSAVGLWDLPVWAGFLAGVAVAALGLPLERNWRVVAAVVGGLLASPITWPRYWMAAVPVVFVLAGRVWPQPKRRAVGECECGWRTHPVRVAAGDPDAAVVLSVLHHQTREHVDESHGGAVAAQVRVG